MKSIIKISHTGKGVALCSKNLSILKESSKAPERRCTPQKRHIITCHAPPPISAPIPCPISGPALKSLLAKMSEARKKEILHMFAVRRWYLYVKKTAGWRQGRQGLIDHPLFIVQPT